MGNFYMEATQINYRRDDTIKTVDQKLQELSKESAIDTDIAPVFKSTSSYEVGDLVYYRNKLYTCTTPHSGAWAAADFTASDVTTAIKSAAAVKADETDIAPAFDATATYAAGDLVYYGGTIYRCTNAHEGDWDADDFSATTISGEIDELNSNLSSNVITLVADKVYIVKTGKIRCLQFSDATAGDLLGITLNSEDRPSYNARNVLHRTGSDLYNYNCYGFATVSNAGAVSIAISTGYNDISYVTQVADTDVDSLFNGQVVWVV